MCVSTIYSWRQIMAIDDDNILLDLFNMTNQKTTTTTTTPSQGTNNEQPDMFLKSAELANMTTQITDLTEINAATYMAEYLLKKV